MLPPFLCSLPPSETTRALFGLTRTFFFTGSIVGERQLGTLFDVFCRDEDDTFLPVDRPQL